MPDVIPEGTFSPDGKTWYPPATTEVTADQLRMLLMLTQEQRQAILDDPLAAACNRFYSLLFQTNYNSAFEQEVLVMWDRIAVDVAIRLGFIDQGQGGNPSEAPQ